MCKARVEDTGVLDVMSRRNVRCVSVEVLSEQQHGGRALANSTVLQSWHRTGLGCALRVPWIRAASLVSCGREVAAGMVRSKRGLAICVHLLGLLQMSGG